MDVPSYMLDKKNQRKKIQIFFIFHRGDHYDFSKKISQKIFLKNHKGPPYEKWKNMKIFFFNFFCPKCSLGHPKMPVRSFFEKSLTNFECVLFVRPRILTTSPFLNFKIQFGFRLNWFGEFHYRSSITISLVGALIKAILLLILVY